VDFIYGKKVNVKKIIIFKSGSDFAAINFDVLNSYFGGIFWREKKTMKKFAYNRVMILIEKVTDLYAE
jgi:hypothetical protein